MRIPQKMPIAGISGRWIELVSAIKRELKPEHAYCLTGLQLEFFQVRTEYLMEFYG